ncbi:9435_t:CDS:2 [Funneliformis geosporum]|uniref:13884_t:CDS:1 n=1 Tax=Funneliformis geosporum TaxID=1117311 RepID=A0A9W4WTK4_9GLOM|nr:13884_t:CDS:2 [Funneliformis geosporum]CAI2185225.1 9435_t:CDS:2 [Funneliformis geosporum]
MALHDVRILVAIDFGTTYSGFAYVHKATPESVTIHCSWPGQEGEGRFKTPTALQYDENYSKITGWGYSALEEEPDEELDDQEGKRSRPVELFKLHLSELQDHEKPWLPAQLSYTKTIEDYLSQMRGLIKETLEKRWPSLKFPQQVDLVFTIPAEWPPNTTRIMRECAYNAGLLTSLNSKNIEFTTEPEAAALHCLTVVKEHNLKPGDTFLVADCGGGTVDLTSRKLLPENKLSEITERIGELCGSTFVDKEFLQWLGRKVGFPALEKLKSNNYGQMQYLVQRFFCQQFVEEEYKQQMEKDSWIIKVNFDDVKDMFDPAVYRIIKLIGDQINSSREKCSAIFLVGGFSESSYLLRKIKDKFSTQVSIIAVPNLPISAIVRGGIAYGLNVCTIQDRTLKWTYGVEVNRQWISGKDKKNRRTEDGYILYFHKLAQRGAKANVDQKFVGEFYPSRPDQEILTFSIYFTKRYDAKFCDDPGMKLLGILKIKTDDTHLGLNRPIEFALTFGKMEIKATAKNKKNGKIYQESNFELNI